MKLSIKAISKQCVSLDNARVAIINEAKSWIGTKFQHQGRTKKRDNHEGACDCLGLIIGVSRSLKLKTKTGSLIHNLDQVDYNIIPDSRKLQQKLSTYLDKKDKKSILPGDIALFAMAGNPQHLGIISYIHYEQKKYLSVIHAYAAVGYVCEHALDTKWHKRLVALYN